MWADAERQIKKCFMQRFKSRIRPSVNILPIAIYTVYDLKIVHQKTTPLATLLTLNGEIA